MAGLDGERALQHTKDIGKAGTNDISTKYIKVVGEGEIKETFALDQNIDLVLVGTEEEPFDNWFSRLPRIDQEEIQNGIETLRKQGVSGDLVLGSYLTDKEVDRTERTSSAKTSDDYNFIAKKAETGKPQDAYLTPDAIKQKTLLILSVSRGEMRKEGQVVNVEPKLIHINPANGVMQLDGILREEKITVQKLKQDFKKLSKSQLEAQKF